MSKAETKPFNICGVLVHARPEHSGSVGRALEAYRGVEVHQRTDDGRLVVSIEDTEDRFAGEMLAEVHKIDGVLNASLVYHHMDTATPSEEDLS